MTNQAPHAPSAEKTRIAVFDLDGTSISGQSGELLSRYLLARRLISFTTMTRLTLWGIRYLLHLPHRQDRPRELIIADLAHLSSERIDVIMRDFHDQILVPLYRPQAIDEVRKRKSEGCLCLLVTATFQTIGDAAAAFLGCDGCIGTKMTVDDSGYFTGTISGEIVVGEGKPHAVQAWADRHLGKGRWELTYAYGDHHSDKPLLESAHTAFAVCPERTLRYIAKREGWPVLEWDLQKIDRTQHSITINRA